MTYTLLLRKILFIVLLVWNTPGFAQINRPVLINIPKHNGNANQAINQPILRDFNNIHNKVTIISSHNNGPQTRNLNATAMQDGAVPLVANTFTVINTNDAGAGSLRQAISSANSTANSNATTPDIITFNIGGGGVPIINLTSALPVITDPVTIDGWSQPGWATTPVIEINGAGVPNNFGLNIQASSCTVRGLAITNFPAGGSNGVGIGIIGAVSGNWIYGCHLGVDASGLIDRGNGQIGLYIGPGATNTLVGTNADGTDDVLERNVISGNNFYGIRIDGSNSTVAGNYIGVGADGSTKLANIFGGIELENGATGNVIGGLVSAKRNVISGSSYGVLFLNAGGNTVQGNYIGTKADGISPLANSIDGVALANTSGANVIGGSGAGAGNVIAFNSYGVYVEGGTGKNIQNNSIFGNAVLGILLNGNSASNDAGDADAGANNLQNFPEFASVDREANGDLTVKYLVPSTTTNSVYPLRIDFYKGEVGQGKTFLSSGVYSSGNAGLQVTQTFTPATPMAVGDELVATATDANGNTSQFSFTAGVGHTFVVTNTNDAGAGSLRQAILNANSAPNVNVSTPDIITFNIPVAGVQIISPVTALPVITESVFIKGWSQPGWTNTPVLEINGTAVPNDFGLNIQADNCTIQGLAINNFKVTIGNGFGIGVFGSFSGTWIYGCHLGLDASGLIKRSNGQGGLWIGSGPTNTLVGTNADGTNDVLERNVISGNDFFGIVIYGINSTIAGNYIGVAADGSTNLGNGEGIHLDNGTTGNVIGGLVPAKRNVISGNGFGIRLISSNGNSVQGNYIGTKADGISALGNSIDGVFFALGTSNNIIGGANAGAGNVIAFNQNGVNVAVGARENIQNNSIFSNSNLGILLGTGATNDAGDGDAGANNLQNYPEFTQVEREANGDLTVKYLVPSTVVNSAYPLRIDFYKGAGGQGKTFLGSQAYASGSAGAQVTQTFTPATAMAAGDELVATATDANGNTSQFSIATVVATHKFIVINTNDAGAGSLRQAILNANATPNFNATTPDTITFNIPGTGVHVITPGTRLPTISESVVINGWSQPGWANTPVIEINGTNVPNDFGLFLLAGNCTVQGLAINNFPNPGGLNGVGIGVFSPGSWIYGCHLGVDASGLIARPNGQVGLYLDPAATNTLAGTNGDGTNDVSERNVISSNGVYGILCKGNNNIVAGNYIGIAADGLNGLGNGNTGIGISGSGNVIGGLVSAKRNVISGNINYGILFGTATGNTVQGNYIGTKADGITALANNILNIAYVNTSNNNTIGGASPGAGNVIAFSQYGVYVETGTGDNIQQNSIFSNSAGGITLVGNGAANDAGDGDAGPNNLQNFPEFAVAEKETNGDLLVKYLVPSTVINSTYPLRIDFYKGQGGQGKTFLGSQTYSAASAGIQVSQTFTPASPINTGDQVVATATDANGNTSQFSAGAVITPMICVSPVAQAYSSNTQTGNQPYRGELGMEFIVNEPGGILIKQLGAFDDGGNGITGLQPGGGVRVAIFNRSTHAIVPGLDVTISGNEDAYTGNHRMVNLASPVTLPPGDYVIVAKGYHSGERNGNSFNNGGALYPVGDDGGGAITFGNETSYGPDDPGGFNYPTNTGNFGSTHIFLAGTFSFTTIVPCNPASSGCESPAAQAYSSNTTTGNNAHRGELGMEFIVNNPGGINIKQLGAFDDLGNGITGLQPGGGVRVAIFNRNTHVIVPGLDVTIIGNAGHYTGNHRLVDITPVTLPPGDYVIVAKGYSSTERNGNSFQGGGPYPPGNTGGGAITFGNETSYGPDDPNGFSYPNAALNLADTHVFLAGTFNFTAVIPCAGACESPGAQAYVSNTQAGNQAHRGELGLEFIVNHPGGINIKQLGAFDDGGNGITGLQPGGGVRVAIFNRNTHAIVPGLDVTIVGNADHYTGNHRMKDIPSVTLLPGDYVIVAKGYHAGERNGNSFVGGGPYPTGDNGGSAITYGNEASYGPDDPTGFNYPGSSVNVGDPHVFLAGTFDFTINVDCPPVAPPILASIPNANDPGKQTEESKLALITKTTDLKVYPNPTKGQFSVQLPDVSASKLTIQVMNSNGKLVEERTTSVTFKTVSLVIPFNLADQPAGIYLIKVEGDDGIRTAKIVIRR